MSRPKDRERDGKLCDLRREEGVMNIQRVGGGWREREREEGWLVLTPVIALMYDLI